MAYRENQVSKMHVPMFSPTLTNGMYFGLYQQRVSQLYDC